jgi:hypothetical protein
MLLATTVDTSTNETTKIVCPSRNKRNKIQNMKCAFCPAKQAELCSRGACQITGKQRLFRFPYNQYLYDGIRNRPATRILESPVMSLTFTILQQWRKQTKLLSTRYRYGVLLYGS